MPGVGCGDKGQDRAGAAGQHLGIGAPGVTLAPPERTGKAVQRGKRLGQKARSEGCMATKGTDSPGMGLTGRATGA